MTVITTVVAGMVIEGVHPLQNISQFYRGLPYAGTLLVILFSHEMGHYLTARHYGMDVTLPYFSRHRRRVFEALWGIHPYEITRPAPPGLIVYRRSWSHRRFCVAIPAVLYAYATSTVAP